jgi:hypothetical protein
LPVVNLNLRNLIHSRRAIHETMLADMDPDANMDFCAPSCSLP